MKPKLHSFIARSLLMVLLGSGIAAGEDPPVFLRQWGTKGTANGQFSSPRGIALDTSGNVYVVELDNNRVQKFTPQGTFIKKWGTWGTTNGQFRYPQTVAIDASNNVYVVDRANDRIQKFTSEGLFITKWGTTGLEDGQFYYPYGLAADTCGHLYVTEDARHRLQKFTSDGLFVMKWGTYGTGNGQFENPFGVAAISCDFVYVVDQGNHRRLQKFTQDGTFVWGLGGYGTGDGQLIQAMGVAVDSFGNVYVADSGNNRIQKFSADGVFLTKWGTAGAGDGQFQFPAALVVDNSGNVYVIDSGNARVQVFGPANHAPVAVKQSVQTPGNTPAEITLSGTDADNDPLSFTIGTPPSHGILSGTPPPVTYVPNANFIGMDSFTFTANDGKATSPPATVSITVYDNTPPVLSGPAIAGTLGSNGWYVSAVTVQWNASDPESGVVTPCPPVSVVSDTIGTTVSCSVTNGSGLSTSASLTLRIDQTPPVVTYAGNAGTYTVDQTVSIVCTAVDATSGIAANTCSNINGPAYSFNLGANNFSATATDNAGNTGLGSATFNVLSTPGTVASITRQLVSDPGIAEALVAKLNAVANAAARGNANAKAGSINAFIHQVNAQTGKSITAVEAEILIRLAQSL